MHSNTILMCSRGQAAIDPWVSKRRTLEPTPTIIIAHKPLEDLPGERELVVHRRQVRPAVSAQGETPLVMIQQGTRCLGQSAGGQALHATHWYAPVENSCLLDVLHGPSSADVVLNQVPDAVEHQARILPVLVKPPAEFPILQ